MYTPESSAQVELPNSWELLDEPESSMLSLKRCGCRDPMRAAGTRPRASSKPLIDVSACCVSTSSVTVSSSWSDALCGSSDASRSVPTESRSCVVGSSGLGDMVDDRESDTSKPSCVLSSSIVASSIVASYEGGGCQLGVGDAVSSGHEDAKESGSGASFEDGVGIVAVFKKSTWKRRSDS